MLKLTLTEDFVPWREHAIPLNFLMFGQYISLSEHEFCAGEQGSY